MNDIVAGIVLCTIIIVLVRLLLKPKTSGGQTLAADLPAVHGWPLLGSILQLDPLRADRTLVQWARELGPVYTVRILHKTWVVVSGYEELQEMLVTKGQAFGGRDRRYIMDAILFGTKDIINSSPAEAHWAPLRKAAHRGIRHYGNGLTRLEETLAAMARDFVNKVTSYNGQPVDLRDDIHNFVMKVAVTMLSGRMVTDDKDADLHGMKMLERLIVETVTPAAGTELDLLPWLTHVGHPLVGKLQKICESRDRLWDSMWRESQKSYTSDGEASCIMHSIAQLTDKNSPHYDPDLDMEHARGLFTDLIVASIATTSGFSYALPNILLHHPHVLKRVQQEVDEIIGTDRQPSIFDRDAMPYSVATILELLRYAALVTLVPHCALEAATLGKYAIPAGTTVIPLFVAVLHDKAFWGDPATFRPERFLDDAGKLLPADHPNRKHMLQFGAGARVCVGEAFALKRLFIFLTSLVQAFDLNSEDCTLTSCSQDSYLNGTVLQQAPYNIRLVSRK